MKKVSVITPCYNVEEYIKTFLDSIVNQTIGTDNIELILIDDSSTDNTPEIIREYEQNYPDMILAIFNEVNIKQGTCRNIALDNYVSGEYFCFIDSDDAVPPYYLEYLYNTARLNNADVIQLKSSSDTNDIAASPAMLTYDTFICDTTDKRKDFLLNPAIMTESCLCKFINKNYYDHYHFHFAEGVAYEEPLFTHPIKHTAKIICRINEPIYYYLINPNGTMQEYMQRYDTICQHMLVQLETYNYVKEHLDIDTFLYEMQLYFVHTFFYETIIFLNARQMPLTAELVRYMCSITKQIIPDIMSNPYLGKEGTYEHREVADYIDSYNHNGNISVLINKLKELK